MRAKQIEIKRLTENIFVVIDRKSGKFLGHVDWVSYCGVTIFITDDGIIGNTGYSVWQNLSEESIKDKIKHLCADYFENLKVSEE